MKADYDDSAEELSEEQQRSRRLRFELIFGSAWLAFGLFLLPAVIFWVGGALLGPYGEKSVLSAFYIDFYGDLADGTARTWMIALGPMVLIYLLRAIFLGVKPKRSEDSDEAPIERPVRPAAARKETKRAPTRAARVEPRMSSD
jgi:hypothetical protein